jgi:oxygen-dependent protoporphyrinogen oxidase
MIDVTIVGAGITGLAAAYELKRRGLSVRVLEASARAGGVIVTERIDGWVIDGGPDSLLVQKPAGIALCREIGLGDRLVPTLAPRTAFVLRGGTLHAIGEGSFLGFPVTLSALLSTSLFTTAGKLRIACEVVVPRRRSGDADAESIAGFIRRRFGVEAADYLAEPLLAGIHAGDAERLSIEALFPRLVDAERRTGSVIRAARAVRPAPTPQGAFVSLAGGTGELVDTLVGALGGAVAFETRATTIGHGETFRVECDRGEVRSRAVIVAIPAYRAAELLCSLDARLAALCDGVAYASTGTVALGFRRDQVRHALRGTGFVVPRVEGLKMLAATWVTSKWPNRAPGDHVLLRAFFGGGRDPGRLECSDPDLVAMARHELGAVLGIDGAPHLARVFRWTRQSPQYEVGHLERVAAIERGLADLPGLFLAGSGFRAIGIPDCIADGRATASRAAAFIAGRG